ncbi:hypothetical protein E1301_Tti022046 [Triplophysa tibetana]|uniref:Cyclic nucleotide-binding domain-containing protein n=1 Tax=Triplophysa tibetana TaxID=1572043 RepID=A0A5A9NQ33_9TELE|nr:hypothetical protein E1301_Tti023154 [Triplophysa tibetana]KAA0712110.1 hypothetical protein E1301_Tti022046 [Triplophysa tibetana]
MYGYASYWVIQIYTTTGYGDIVAKSFGEMIMCIIIMIMSKMQVVFIMGHLASTQTNKRVLQEAYEEKLETIKTYMKQERIPTKIQKRVMEFYSYRWNRTSGTDAEDLFKDIHTCLKTEILSSICENTLRNDQLFIEYPSPFLRDLCTRMIIRCFPIGEFIYRKGDVGTGMYLLLIGDVKICEDSRGSKISRRLCAGKSFGHEFLMKRTLFKDTAIAENYVDVAILSKESFEAVGLLYPSIMRKLLKEASSL